LRPRRSSQFALGVAAVFPAPLTTGAARALPVLLVLVAMFYWLWRIRSRAIPARA
jgi:Ser/Thr protein kinase RdoA (MazF antagonist)